MPGIDVLITGLGVVSSIGIGGDAFFQSLVNKQSGIRSLSERTDDGARPAAGSELTGVWLGGPIIDFDPKQYVRPRKALKVMCREIQTAFAASQLAVENAGLSDCIPADPAGQLQPQDLGTVFGGEMYYGPPTEMEDAIRACIREDGTIDGASFGGLAMKNVMPLWMLKYLPNMPACHVGISINAHGPNNTLVLGDVSGPAAMIEAAACIDRGNAQTMITGCSGTRINTTRLNYRHDLPIAEVCDPIERSSRPHDPASHGVVGGEGAVAFVLEHVDHVSQRGARPLARLVSYASRFVASEGMSLPLRSAESTDPPVRGSARAIRLAIETAMGDAGLSAGALGLVVSSAAGDPLTDAAEREALEAILPGVPGAAPAAALGHTGAAVGSMSMAVGVLALARDTIPPTLCAESAAPSVGFRGSAEPLTGTHVLCLSHTPEGNATAVILAKA